MIKTKRWDDPVESDDGTRILVTRYRPRALRKENETWDEWLRDLGPSAELHAAFYGKNGDPISWTTYVPQYKREMQSVRHLISTLAERAAQGETLTLLCSSSCMRETRCHRSLLRDLILAAMQKTASTPGVC